MFLNQKTGGYSVFCLVIGTTNWAFGAIVKKSTPFTRFRSEFKFVTISGHVFWAVATRTKTTSLPIHVLLSKKVRKVFS